MCLKPDPGELVSLAPGAIIDVFDRRHSVDARALGTVLDNEPAPNVRLNALSKRDWGLSSQEIAHSFDNSVEGWPQTEIGLRVIYRVSKPRISISQ